MCVCVCTCVCVCVCVCMCVCVGGGEGRILCYNQRCKHTLISVWTIARQDMQDIQCTSIYYTYVVFYLHVHVHVDIVSILDIGACFGNGLTTVVILPFSGLAKTISWYSRGTFNFYVHVHEIGRQQCCCTKITKACLLVQSWTRPCRQVVVQALHPSST